jgi:chitodextrinase
MNKKRFSPLRQGPHAPIILAAVAIFNAACAEPSSAAKVGGLADRYGTASQREKLKVRAASVGDIAQYDETVAYAGGDIVDFNGTLYRARWWTLGDLPSIDYVWELLVDHPPGRQR